MKPMIGDLVLNQEVTSYFMVTDAQQRKTKRDKPYMSMKFMDRTGEVDAKLWDIPNGFDIATLKKGEIIKVRAIVNEFAGQDQLNVNQIRVITSIEQEVLQGAELDIGDFFRRSKLDPDDMWSDLGKLLTEHMSDGPLSDLIRIMLGRFEGGFKRSPAAKSKHHCFLGGLLEHVLSMARVAVPLCDHYKLDKTLVLAAVVLHDIGKIWELDCEFGISYTSEGTLIGHIPLGMELVSHTIAEIPNFPARTKMELVHLILAHHGLLEWGSPRVPLMREAILLHQIDMIDSRMGLCQQILDGSKESGDFTGFISDIGGPLYKANVFNEPEVGTTDGQ